MYDGMLDNLYPVHYFTFNGKRSLDYGMYLRGSETWRAPERDITSVSIPGRSGDLTIDNGRFKNIVIPYVGAWILEDWETKWETFKNHLLADSEYHKLTDTFHDGYYRMARFTGPIEPEVVRDSAAGGFEVAFDCKPQCYLNEGDEWQTVASESWLFNATPFEALPLLEIRGSGTLTWYGKSYTILSRPNTQIMYIDSELQEIYSEGKTGLSDYVIFNSGYDFPTLKYGSTSVSLSGISLRVKTRLYKI